MLFRSQDDLEFKHAYRCRTKTALLKQNKQLIPVQCKNFGLYFDDRVRFSVKTIPFEEQDTSTVKSLKSIGLRRGPKTSSFSSVDFPALRKNLTEPLVLLSFDENGVSVLRPVECSRVALEQC